MSGIRRERSNVGRTVITWPGSVLIVARVNFLILVKMQTMSRELQWVLNV
jgi:hypothetical protein